jgi:hypothetical protein
MAVTDGDYVTGTVLKRTLHISHANYDDEISDIIRFVEGKLNSILQEHTTAPITKDDDIEQIAVMLCTARFELLIRENLTEDLFARMNKLEKTAMEDFKVYILHNYSGRSKYSTPSARRVTPDDNTNLLTDLF